MKFNSYCIKSENSVVHKVIFFNTINGVAQLSNPVKKSERFVDYLIGSVDSFIEDNSSMVGYIMKDGKMNRVRGQNVN